ncbi:hypothetical protein M1146_06290 [Patescibacteria group bacterium]|nr:hypothetical protein [Patescibacteria group bacterium]
MAIKALSDIYTLPLDKIITTTPTTLTTNVKDSLLYYNVGMKYLLMKQHLGDSHLIHIQSIVILQP